MAKGYPDYFGTSIWPKYGTMLIGSGALPCNAAVLYDLFSLTGAGVFYFLRLVWDDNALSEAGLIYFIVDGEIILSTRVDELYLNGFIGSPRQLLKCTNYDAETKKGGVELGFEIPFTNSLKIQFDSALGYNISFSWRYGWYKVT